MRHLHIRKTEMQRDFAAAGLWTWRGLRAHHDAVNEIERQMEDAARIVADLTLN